MTKQEYIEQGKKVLTLQIDKECFATIFSGKQKIEHRYIYPSNATRYVYFEADGKTYQHQDDIPNDVSEFKPIPMHYDALYLINGRRKDAPRMMVEVESAEFVILTDEQGNDLTYMYDGEEYFACQVWYHLGNIILTENIKSEEDTVEFCGGLVVEKLSVS